MRILLSLLLNILFICSAWSQPLRDTGKPPVALKPWAPDRNIVMDYFQNQQFAEAIDYLQPAFTADSNNINALTWLALSYYNLKEYPECVSTCEYMLSNGLDVESMRHCTLRYGVLSVQGAADALQLRAYQRDHAAQ